MEAAREAASSFLPVFGTTAHGDRLRWRALACSEFMVNDKPSLASVYSTHSATINALLYLSALLLLVGIFAPVLTFKKLVLFSNTISIVSGVVELLREGHVMLGTIVTVFSIVLPVCKLIVLHRLWNGAVHDRAHYQRYLHWIAQYGKWSMLDVFVVALLVVIIKLGAVGQVDVHYGIYAFAASVLLTMFVTARVVALTRELGSGPDGGIG